CRSRDSACSCRCTPASRRCERGSWWPSESPSARFSRPAGGAVPTLPEGPAWSSDVPHTGKRGETSRAARARQYATRRSVAGSTPAAARRARPAEARAARESATARGAAAGGGRDHHRQLHRFDLPVAARLAGGGVFRHARTGSSGGIDDVPLRPRGLRPARWAFLVGRNPLGVALRPLRAGCAAEPDLEVHALDPLLGPL